MFGATLALSVQCWQGSRGGVTDKGLIVGQAAEFLQGRWFPTSTAFQSELPRYELHLQYLKKFWHRWHIDSSARLPSP
jgi:hypothetical protein